MTVPEENMQRHLQGLEGWEFLPREGALRQEFHFQSFRAAIAFVDKVADIAEGLDHHPSIAIDYRRVTLRLKSWDAGGVTGRDIRLARRIGVLAGPPSP